MCVVFRCSHREMSTPEKLHPLSKERGVGKCVLKQMINFFENIFFFKVYCFARVISFSNLSPDWRIDVIHPAVPETFQQFGDDC